MWQHWGCASQGGSPTLYITWGGQDCLLHLQVSSSLAEKGSSLPSNNVGHLTRSTEGPGRQDTLHISQWSGPMNPVLSSRKPWSGLDPNAHHHSFGPFPTCSTQLRTEWFSKVHLDREITSLTIFFFFFKFFIFFLNFKIFNSYMRSQTWTPLPPLLKFV